MQDLRFWQGFCPLLFSIQTACLRPGGIHGLWLPGVVSAPPTSPAIARGTVWAQTQHQALAWAPSETYLCSFLPAAPMTYRVLLQSYALSFASAPVSGCVSRHWSPVSSCSWLEPGCHSSPCLVWRRQRDLLASWYCWDPTGGHPVGEALAVLGSPLAPSSSLLFEQPQSCCPPLLQCWRCAACHLDTRE